jgi:hypothetical protein
MDMCVDGLNDGNEFIWHMCYHVRGHGDEADLMEWIGMAWHMIFSAIGSWSVCVSKDRADRQTFKRGQPWCRLILHLSHVPPTLRWPSTQTWGAARADCIR